MQLLLFAGSLRKDSFNKKLLGVAEKIVSNHSNCNTTIIDLKNLSIPIYDGDVEDQGIPEGVTQLANAIQKSDGLVIASPEYNHSISSPLKNAIDWVSRIKPLPWEGKPTLLMGATVGAYATLRAISHARTPLAAVGTHLFPKHFGLPHAESSFLPTGELKDSKMHQTLKRIVDSFLVFVEKLKTEQAH